MQHDPTPSLVEPSHCWLRRSNRLRPHRLPDLANPPGLPKRVLQPNCSSRLSYYGSWECSNRFCSCLLGDSRQFDPLLAYWHSGDADVGVVAAAHAAAAAA